MRHFISEYYELIEESDPNYEISTHDTLEEAKIARKEYLIKYNRDLIIVRVTREIQ